MSPKQFLERIIVGKAGVLHEPALPEGLTLRRNAEMGNSREILFMGEVVCEQYGGDLGMWVWANEPLTSEKASAFDAEYPDAGKLEKPLGFELHDKRATKASDPASWTPADAVYDASLRMQGKEVTQLVVYWWEKQEGREVLKWSNATSGIAEHGWLLQRALNALMEPK